MSQTYSSEGLKALYDFLFTIFGKAFLPFLIPFIAYKIFVSNFHKKQIEGKVVLITGASSGLGESLAHVFYCAGCKVILASRRIEELERVRNELMEINTNKITFEPKVLQLDLENINSLPLKADEARSIHGCIDILINNGGVSFRGDIVSTPMDVHLKVMTVNYLGPVALTKALLPSMIAQGHGHIVGISSIQGRIAIPHRSAYAASKHALQAFMDCLRSETANNNLKVTVISPGYINTDLSKNAITSSGNPYGVTDPTTASGYNPYDVATKVLSAVVKQQTELTVATLGPKMGILLRVLCPNLFFYLMKRRANKNT